MSDLLKNGPVRIGLEIAMFDCTLNSFPYRGQYKCIGNLRAFFRMFFFFFPFLFDDLFFLLQFFQLNDTALEPLDFLFVLLDIFNQLFHGFRFELFVCCALFTDLVIGRLDLLLILFDFRFDFLLFSGFKYFKTAGKNLPGSGEKILSYTRKWRCNPFHFRKGFFNKTGSRIVRHHNGAPCRI